LILPPEQYAHCSAAIKHAKFNEDLKKLVYSHPKDFAVRQKLAEIFIFQCDFTGKVTQPSSVTSFRVLEYFPIHTGKSQQAMKMGIFCENFLSIWIAVHCARQSRLGMCNFYFKINLLIKNFFLLPASLHFARENTVSKNEVSLFFSKFW